MTEDRRVPMTLKLKCLTATAAALALPAAAHPAPTPATVSTKTVAAMNAWINAAGANAKVKSAECRPAAAAYVCAIKLAPPWAATIFYYRVRVVGGVFSWQAIN